MTASTLDPDWVEDFRKEAVDELDRGLFIVRDEEDQLCMSKLGYDARHWREPVDAIVAHAQQVTDEHKPVFWIGRPHSALGRHLNANIVGIEARAIDLHDAYNGSVAEMLNWPGPNGADAAWCEVSRRMFEDFATSDGAQRADIVPDPEEVEVCEVRPTHVPPFPVEVFPEPVQRLIGSISAAMNVTPHYSATHVLPVIATAARGKWWIYAKADQVMPPTIWNAAIARPGFNKSGPFGVIRSPIVERHKEQAKKWRDEVADWAGNGKSGERPVQQRQILDDATMEATKQALDENGDALGMLRDELGGWLQDMDKYRPKNAGGSSDHADWIKCWDGDFLEVTRRNTEACFYVEHAQVSISGAIQPSIARDCLVKTKASGFASRMLLSKLPYVPASWSEDVVDDGLVEEWRQTVEAVMDTKPTNDGEPVMLKSTGAARRRYSAWVNSFAKRDFHNHVKADDEGRGSVNAKLRTYVWRFAGLLAILEAAAAKGDALVRLRSIELHHVANAIMLAEWWHARMMDVYADWEEGGEDAEARMHVLSFLSVDEWQAASVVSDALKQAAKGIGWKRFQQILAALESSGQARSRTKPKGKGTEWRRIKREAA